MGKDYKRGIEKEYFQRVSLYSYYRNGQLIKLSSSCELIMLNIFLEGLDVITDKEFSSQDVLLINLNLEGIAFDKLMCKVKFSEKIGDMNKICLEFIGIPNFLFEKLKSMGLK